MIDTRGYLVGPADLSSGAGPIETFGSIDAAVGYADGTGGTVYVYQPLSESAHWDWGLRGADGADPKFAYASESAARNSQGLNSTVVKARRGQTPQRWQPAD